MYGDNNDSKYTVRSLLLKLFLIFTVIIILIWIVPKFLSYNKKVKNDEKPEKLQVVNISESAFNKLTDAGLKFFTEDNIPNEIGDSNKVTLKELKKANLVKVKDIKIASTVCDVDRSYVKLTKNQEDYTLKSYLRCGSSKDYNIINVDKYGYCDGTLLCQKNDDLENEEISNDSDTDSNNDTENNYGSKNLSEFSKWGDYVRTSCDEKEVTCDINDVNCLQEVKLYSRKELVGTKSTPYYTEHIALKLSENTNRLVCSNYNYFIINNVIYKTSGLYGEVLNLNKNSTSNWTYKGKVSTTTSPSFGTNEYYKYQGTENGVHYYDLYKYNYSISKVTSYSSGCSNQVNKNVPTYVVYKQKETYTKKENVYATACYKSIRTRKYE